jgi:hypothetical protein
VSGPALDRIELQHLLPDWRIALSPPWATISGILLLNVKRFISE